MVRRLPARSSARTRTDLSEPREARGRPTDRLTSRETGVLVREFIANVVNWLLELGANLTTLVVYATLGAALFTAWRRTLGRPRALARGLTSLAPSMQVDYFIETLGLPAFRSTCADAEDLVWVRPEAFIRAVSEDGTVMVYAITTRKRRFAPTFMKGLVITVEGDSLEVQLGRTRFGDVPFGPSRVYGQTAARRQGYVEYHYYGNPGAYLTYAYALSDVGWQPPSSSGLVSALVNDPDIDVRAAPDASDALPQLDPKVVAQRSQAAFNTFAVLSSAWAERANDLGFTPGADQDLVRLALYTRGLSWTDSVRTRFRRRNRP